MAHGTKDATDVTAVVADVVKDDRLSITAGNEFFGDTASGVRKKFYLEYIPPALRPHFSARFGGSILSCIVCTAARISPVHCLA